MSRPEKSFRASAAVESDRDLSFADAFENAPHAMALVNVSGRLLSANRALCRMLGYSRDELLRSNISSLTHPDDLETDWEQRQRLARADIGRYELNQRYLRRNGESVWVRLSVSATRRTSWELAYFVLQAEAVAPPRCPAIAEDESPSLRRFGDATLSAMHEIGNTLTPLMMNAELIVEQSVDDSMKGFAHEIFKAARRIAFTLRRLRKIEDHQPVAYIGSDRLLDLRMVPPPSADGDGDKEGVSLDTGTQRRQN